MQFIAIYFAIGCIVVLVKFTAGYNFQTLVCVKKYVIGCIYKKFSYIRYDNF